MAKILPRSLFFHNPKCGGTTIRKALQNAFPSCKWERGSHHCFPDEIDTGDRFCFVFVRHPVTWYESFFVYKNEVDHWLTGHPLEPCKSDRFDHFIEKVLKLYPGHLSTMYEFYLGYPVRMNFVGKVENLTEDLIAALHLAGEEFDEAKIRNTPRHNASTYKPRWNPKLKEAIIDAEKRTFIRFGYKR